MTINIFHGIFFLTNARRIRPPDKGVKEWETIIRFTTYHIIDNGEWNFCGYILIVSYPSTYNSWPSFIIITP